MIFHDKRKDRTGTTRAFKNEEKRCISLLLPIILSLPLALPLGFMGQVVASPDETAEIRQENREQRTASVLTIKNDDTSDIDVFIEPGEGTIIASSPHIKRVIEPGKEITLTVTKKDLGNGDTFSVKGTVLVPSLYNRSSGLFFGTNYRVVFTGSKVGGTVCHVNKIDAKEKEKAQ